jgi:hypothetical protein
MPSFKRLLFSVALLLGFFSSVADAACADCCKKMGGTQYCDSSTGRFVCSNGEYSSCYCTRHAVMDLQRISGCCVWQGGVLNIDDNGLVVCNNGGVSEECTLQNPKQSIATW